jgi:hypothetical protein
MCRTRARLNLTRLHEPRGTVSEWLARAARESKEDEREPECVGAQRPDGNPVLAGMPATDSVSALRLLHRDLAAVNQHASDLDLLIPSWGPTIVGKDLANARRHGLRLP